MSQAEIQGIFSERVEHLNTFARVMADIQVSHNPLAQDVTLIFNKKTSDVYYDTSIEEETRIKKRVLISKKYNLYYVQDLFQTLVEPTTEMPWIVTLTLTSLPRHLQMDDQILIGDELYTVSRVSPKNRIQDSIQKVLIYNERAISTQLQDNPNIY